MFKNRFKKKRAESSYAMPKPTGEPTKGYEGKEHVKYQDNEKSRHFIKYPQDEPHMKSRVSKEESHQAEDNYHMPVKITEQKLPAKIPRARMEMEMEDRRSGGKLKRYGNLVSMNGKGIEDENTGTEKMGPMNYQSDDESKASERKDEADFKGIRKKVIAGVLKKKMKYGNKYQ